MLRLVVVSGASHDAALILDVVLHECAHSWLIGDPASGCETDTSDLFNAEVAALLSAAWDPKLMNAVFKAEKKDEDQADELAAHGVGGYAARPSATTRVRSAKRGTWHQPTET